MSLTFGTFCSGIEAASEAWLPLGWICRYVAEIEPWPCFYLHQRHGAGRPRYMPRPDDVAFPEGLDPDDRALFASLSRRGGAGGEAELSPAEAAFLKAWKERAGRRNAIRLVGRLSVEGRLLNLGDIGQVSPDELPRVDVAGAGFPCQDFSIAGLRASLDGARGNLSITGTRLLLDAAELGLVRAALLEQVPDVLNTADNAWGNILGALVGADAALEGLDHGGKWPRAGMVAGPRSRVAWRILDAQHFGLAQRRERVWAVVDFGDGPDPAAVLFERKGLPGHPQASGEAGEGVAPTLKGSLGKRGGQPDGANEHGLLVPERPQRRAAFGGNNTAGPIDVATARTASQTASGRQDFESETFIVDGDYGAYRPATASATLRAEGGDAGHGSEALVASATVSASLRAQHNASLRADSDVYIAHALRAEGHDASEDGSGRGAPLVPVVFPTLTANVGEQTGRDAESGCLVPVAFTCKDYGADAGEVAPTLRAMGHSGSHANAGGQVAIAIRTNQTGANGSNVSLGVGFSVTAGDQPQAVAFSLRGREGGAMPEVEDDDVVPALRAADGGSTRPFVAMDEVAPGGAPAPAAMAVRRITVVEAERLQGFPDNATLIHWPSAGREGQDLAETVAYLIGHGFSPAEAEELAQTPDGPRYRALGNSWPVNVAAWIGGRIDADLSKEPA